MTEPGFILDPSIMVRLREAFIVGSTVNDACLYAGVSRDRYYDWHKRGREYEEHLEAGGEIIDGEDIYRRMFLEVRAAKAGGRRRALVHLHDHMKTHWQACAWFLERTDRARWGRHVTPGTELLEEDEEVIAALNVTDVEVTLAKALGPWLERVKSENELQPVAAIEASSTVLPTAPAPPLGDEPGDT